MEKELRIQTNREFEQNQIKNSIKNIMCTYSIHVLVGARLLLQNKKLRSLVNFFSKPRVWIRGLEKNKIKQTY